jgi:hypothetical protein
VGGRVSRVSFTPLSLNTRCVLHALEKSYLFQSPNWLDTT